jgi:nucleotide-binding universal stress UspA family protein
MKSSYAQLLVHVDPSAHTAGRMRLAGMLATPFGASVTGLYAATSAQSGLAFSPEAGPEMVRALIEIDDNNLAQARKAFDASQAAAPSKARWAQVKGAPIVTAFAQQAFFADLLVLGQADPTRNATVHVPGDFVEGVVVASGKPALLVPYVGAPASLGRTIVIAWKPTCEAARAVAAAMPLLQRAEAVHVVSWEADEEPIGGDRLDLSGYLALHGVKASFHQQGAETDDLGELLLSRAFDLQADLLVMGCYGHSRAREWALGGVSRTILKSMTLPVLMAH